MEVDRRRKVEMEQQTQQTQWFISFRPNINPHPFYAPRFPVPFFAVKMVFRKTLIKNRRKETEEVQHSEESSSVLDCSEFHFIYFFINTQLSLYADAELAQARRPCSLGLAWGLV